MTARHLIVHGHVQGVSYRDWTAPTARELGLGGLDQDLGSGPINRTFEAAEWRTEYGPTAPARSHRLDHTLRPSGLDEFSQSLVPDALDFHTVM